MNTPNSNSTQTIQLIDQKAFNALSTYQKRVAICKDVIERMENKLLSPKTQIFFTDKFYPAWEAAVTPQEYINTHACNVCAKGAIMCSWVGNFNKYNKAEVYRFSELVHIADASYPVELIEIFGKNLLDTIESAFEGYGTSILRTFPRRDSKEMLHDIMTNIIKNNGKMILNDGSVIT